MRLFNFFHHGVGSNKPGGRIPGRGRVGLTVGPGVFVQANSPGLFRDFDVDRQT